MPFPLLMLTPLLLLLCGCCAHRSGLLSMHHSDVPTMDQVRASELGLGYQSRPDVGGWVVGYHDGRSQRFLRWKGVVLPGEWVLPENSRRARGYIYENDREVHDV